MAARSTGPTSQQAFLEGHELAFRHFGGVFRLLRYDNLTSAVRKVLRGRLREETERFIALRSHWHFEADFCTPGAGHEKGGVEGENGYFRRNHWVPVPKAASLEVLNELLLMLLTFISMVVATGLALGAVVLLAVLWTMGLTGHVGLPVTVVSSAVPILMVFKIICDHAAPLKGVGEFLSC